MDQLPFMLIEHGRVMFYDGNGRHLPDFQGLCHGATVHEFWWVGWSKGERSFSLLHAQNAKDAQLEARRRRLVRLLMSHENLSFTEALVVLATADVDSSSALLDGAVRNRHRFNLYQPAISVA